MRKSANLVLASSLILLSATLAGAQTPQPTGMLSPTNPVLFTFDGVPDGNGDQPAYIDYQQIPTGPIGFLEVQFDGVICNGAPSFPFAAAASQTGMPFDGFGRSPDEAVIDDLDMSDAVHPRPIGAAFQEIGGGANGSAAMVDSNGNHRYERMVIAGNNSQGPVAAELDLRSFDADGDGLPEYVTLFDPSPSDPQFNLAVLQFFGLACDSNQTPFSQAWIPVARDLDGDPAIIGDLDGDGQADPEFYWGPKLQIGGNVLAIPTVSGLGLAALAGLLLLISLRLMRRHRLAAGI